MDKNINKFYGKDCPRGMVQVEFVGCSPNDKYSDYGWKPVKSTFLEIYIDGQRFSIDVGDFNDGSPRRGLHIVGPLNLKCKQTCLNSCSIFVDQEGG